MIAHALRLLGWPRGLCLKRYSQPGRRPLRCAPDAVGVATGGACAGARQQQDRYRHGRCRRLAAVDDGGDGYDGCVGDGL